METKICKKCGKELPVDKFYKNKSQKDGFGYYCKDCVNAYKFRYLTPVEMCRLQTLPDDYLDGIAPNTAMSLAGNGWTVDVIAHLLRSIERKQINDIVKEFRKITDELMFGSLETDIM